jgi:hypothetical protein
MTDVGGNDKEARAKHTIGAGLAVGARRPPKDAVARLGRFAGSDVRAPLALEAQFADLPPHAFD